MKLVIFDVDGTLLDSLPDITCAANIALEQLGLRTFIPTEVRPMSGGGAKRLMERCITRAQNGVAPTADQVKRAVRAKSAYANGPSGHALTEPFPGVYDMLRALQSHGVQLAVLSNAEEAIIRRLMEKHFPDIRFTHVAGQRPGVPPKPDPTSTKGIVEHRFDGVTPADCLFVGDTDNDMKAACGAGCTPVGVSWGCRDPEHLYEAGAVHCVKTTKDVVEYVVKPPSNASADA